MYNYWLIVLLMCNISMACIIMFEIVNNLYKGADEYVAMKVPKQPDTELAIVPLTSLTLLFIYLL